MNAGYAVGSIALIVVAACGEGPPAEALPSGAGSASAAASATESATETETESATEAATEAATESATESATEAATESATETETETEAATEAATETEPEPGTEPDPPRPTADVLDEAPVHRRPLLRPRGGGEADSRFIESPTWPGRVVPAPVRLESGPGSFDASVVDRTIRARVRAIHRCYERELHSNPTLAGVVVVRMTITAAGTVDPVEAIESTPQSPALVTCVTNTVRRFRFNPGPEGGSVTYTARFIMRRE